MCEYDEDYSVWTCKDGTLVPIKEMEDAHLCNCIAFSIKKIKRYKEYPEHRLQQVIVGCGGGDGDWSDMDVDVETIDLLERTEGFLRALIAEKTYREARNELEMEIYRETQFKHYQRIKKILETKKEDNEEKKSTRADDSADKMGWWEKMVDPVSK